MTTDPRVSGQGSTRLTRRAFVGGLAQVGLSLGGLGALGCLNPRGSGQTAGNRSTLGYGPLAPVSDETTGLRLLELPTGFRYLSFGWTGDPLEDGSVTPRAHDGMCAFPAEPGRVRLIRNHELRSDAGVFSRSAPAYDPAAAGGTTTVEFDTARGEFVRAWPSLTGTLTNCAGGGTPWGTWLSCEETVEGIGSGRFPGLTRSHGYVFEVPADGTAEAVPLREMGRFLHEAVAVDPASGIAYLTEDAAQAGLYRFTPKTPGKLADGGRLEMLAVADRPRMDTRTGQRDGVSYPVSWVPIEEPDPDEPLGHGTFRQGLENGGAIFLRLEGAFFFEDLLYFVSTNGGDVGRGQIWVYDPGQERLHLLFESRHPAVLDHPDNITVSPRGGIVLCEDGFDTEFLHGLTGDGEIFRFCQNRVLLLGQKNKIFGDFTGAEFAGACFDPSGEWLFVNIQNPGISVAITGPWERGPL